MFCFVGFRFFVCLGICLVGWFLFGWVFFFSLFVWGFFLFFKSSLKMLRIEQEFNSRSCVKWTKQNLCYKSRCFKSVRLLGAACCPPSFCVTEIATKRIYVFRSPIENQTLKFSIPCSSYLLYSPFSPGLKGCSGAVVNATLSVHVYRIVLREQFSSPHYANIELQRYPGDLCGKSKAEAGARTGRTVSISL